MPQGYQITIPRMRFDDQNGNPLALGKVYFYEAGTVTPQNTWSNSDLSSLNTNPVILSTSGECTIFVPAATLYKVNLTDANDVQQPGWPIDGVLAVPAPDPPAPTPSPVPAGGIIAYGGAAAPTGYLLCNGAVISRATYAALFTAIGTAFGAGDGSTTFGLPDMRQRFPLGVAASGTGNTLGGTGGTIDHTHTGPSHTHTGSVDVSHTHNVTVAAHTHDVTVPRSDWPNVQNVPSVGSRLVVGDSVTSYYQPSSDRVVSSASAGAINQNTGAASVSVLGLTIAAAGTGVTGTGNPPFVALNYIIKT